MNTLRKIFQYYGLQGFVTKLQRRFGKAYTYFLKSEMIPTLAEMQAKLATFAFLPRISVITPLYQPKLSELEAYFSALLEQNGYENIELCLVDDGTSDASLDAFIGEYQKKFPEKIKYQKNQKNRGIAAASNDALQLATGMYVALVDQDDVVAPHAFFEYVQAAQTKQYDFFYADEDMLSLDGKRFNPNFKPDWSPHTLLSRMYVNHLSMYKTSIVKRVGGFRSAFDGCQDYDLLLRAASHFGSVYHAPQILYHWRASKASIAAAVDNKKYIYARAEAALREHLLGEGLQAQVRRVDEYLIYNLAITHPQAKLNAIIFNVEGDLKDVAKSWASLIHNLASNQMYVIYVIDEKQMFDVAQEITKIKIISVRSLSAALEALKQNEVHIESHVLFLASHVEFVQSDTLVQLVQLTQLPSVHVLAPTIINQDMVISEAGRIIIDEEILAFANFGVSFGENNYFGNTLSIVNYSFVSPDCFLIKKDLLQKIEGSDTSDTFMELLINLRTHEFFYCVNVGNHYVRRLKNSFVKTYTRPHNQKIKIVEHFYNKNLAQEIPLLYQQNT